MVEQHSGWESEIVLGLDDVGTATNGRRFGRRSMAIVAAVVVIGVVGSTAAYAYIAGANYSGQRSATLAAYAPDVAVPSGPYGMAYDGSNVWVASSGDRSINGTGQAVSKITTTGVSAYSVLPAYPNALAYDGTNMWSSGKQSNIVSKISPSGVVTNYNLPANANPTDIAYDGSNMWTSNYGTNNVSKISSSGTIVNYPVAPGAAPVSIAFDGSSMWTANQAGSSVSKVGSSGSLVTYPLASGSYPYAIAFDGTSMWTANLNATVSRISSTGVVTSFPLLSGSLPTAIAIDQPGYSSNTNPIDPTIYLWVTNSNLNSVSKINSSTGAIVATYPVGKFPNGLVFDGTNMWVSNSTDSSVAKIRVR